jgi:transcription initiation factor TFIID subunit 5
MWDIHSGTCVRIFPGHNGPVTSLAISPLGKTMASAGTDNIIRLWDLASGNLIKTMVGHESLITTLEFSKNGTLLSSGSDDDTVRIWNAQTADSFSLATRVLSGERVEKSECIKSFPTKRTPIYSVSYTNRNILVALGSFCPL